MSEPMTKVIQDLKTSMNATATYLAFLGNIGHKAFRREVKKTDAELEKYIADQNLNIIQMAREHLLAWKWMNETGRLPMFEEYRCRVKEALREDAKETERQELEEFTKGQLGEGWAPDEPPAQDDAS